ncbi:MAG: hypothetical protein ACK4ND_00945, partial [Cytophagaceae bacterium]
MVEKLIKISFIVLFISHTAVGQIKFSDDPGSFVQEVSNLLKNTKNDKCIKTAGDFLNSWNSLNSSNQAAVIDISKMMAKKRLRASPHFNDFMSAIHGALAQGMSATDVDTFLIVTKKVLENLDNKQINIYFTTIRTLLSERKLYSSTYNTLSVDGGTFRFKYIEAAPEYNPYDNYGGSDTQEEEDPWAEIEEKSMVDRQQDFFSDWDVNYEDEWGSVWEDEPAPAEDFNIYDVGYAAAPQPAIDGPVIEFENISFRFQSGVDSVSLSQTSGSFMFKNNLFVGSGGRFDWSSVGYQPEELYVELKEYNFDVKSPKVSAEGVTLHFPDKTDQEVEGVFEYTSKKTRNINERQYPRFRSYNSKVNIKGLGDDISYHGGISLAGRNINSSSLDEGFSTIEIKKNGQTKLRAVSNRFGLGDSLITSEYARITLYTERDSIYHPGTEFKYNRTNSYLRITKTQGYRHAPFIDTYHKMGITADALLWDLNSTQIDFTILNAKNHIPAVFESEEYYEYNKYSLLQGIYRFHPLQMIIGYSEQKKTDEMFVDELARTYKLEETTIRGSMTAMMKHGFIDYNIKTGHIKLRDKAKHYVLARRDKKDYDNLTFVSLFDGGSNATFNLETNELKVRGVDKIKVSDSLSVYIVPDNNEVTILENRDFSFNGKINTANFQFIGEGFVFNYDSFLVHMPSIDQIKLAAANPDKDSKDKSTRVLGNELKYSSGTLYINKPDNKSARKHLAQYPIFDATTGATVFFDKQEIAGGAYDTTLQFKIPPFVVDSLSSDDPHAIGFDGTFSSGGIFPEFEEKLVVMPDYSLGFVHPAPKDGYQLYEGKGRFYNVIRMNNNGLTGDGEIHFLNTTCKSGQFHFYPDSVITIGTTAVTQEGPNPDLDQAITFADFSINSYEMRWLVKQDSMLISNGMEEPFRIYNKLAIFNGTSIVTEEGLYGFGVLETNDSQTASPNFHFEQTQYEGRNSTFIIKSDNPSKPAVKGTDVKLEFDLTKKKAFFSPEIKGFASNEFPYSQYKSSIDNGVWDMGKKKVFMSMPKDGDINQSYFYSTKKDQDSLVFNASEATYDIEKLQLNINGVPFIRVADTKVYPDSNKVTILENAKMVTLKNSRVEMDTINTFHKLYNGEIDINSRFKLSGNALYDYVNPSEKTLVLEFKDFNYDQTPKKKEDRHTVATGLVMPEDSMEISDKLLYKGKATMYAHLKPLYWDGYVKLNLEGALSFSQWLKYKNDGD